MVRGLALQAVAVVALTCATAVRCSLVLLEEAQNLTKRNPACFPMRCDARRHTTSRLAFNLTPADIPPLSFQQYPCFCDDDCFIFKDCCLDLALNQNATHPEDDSIHGFPLGAWSCQFFTSLKVGQIKLEQFAWMVSRCPEDAAPNLVEQCAALAPDRTYIHDLPVIAGGVLFKNIYCASCHAMTYNDLFPLNLEISCEAQNVTSQDLVYASYVPGKLKFILEDNSTCQLDIKEFRDLSALNKNLAASNLPALRPCRNAVIGWCPEDQQDADLIQKCSSYLVIVQEIDPLKRLFRNPHCALCNNVTNFSCGASPSTRFHGVAAFNPKQRMPTGSLSIIFHFNFGGSNVVGHDACAKGFVWDAIFQKCQPIYTCDADAKYKLALCGDEDENESASQTENNNGTNLDCDKVVLEQKDFVVLENGSIYVNNSKVDVVTDVFVQLDDSRVEVCVETVWAMIDDGALGGAESFSPLQGTLSLVCTVISLIGLTLHILVLLALPKLRNLPGLISMSISVSLMVAQILFLIATSPAKPAEYGGCVAMAAVLHFAFLSVFAWTAVMSFDIWRAFSHPTGNRSSRKSQTKNMQFIKYCCFAAIIPLVIVGIALGLDLSGLDLALSPQYGLSSDCWFGSRFGLAIFFALPVFLILLFNLSLYALVVLRIREQRKATKFLEERPSSRHAKYTESDCKLHFSIFNVMGGTWLLGLFAGLVDHPILWMVYIILNGSQGAIIFALQILKPRVLHMIRNRLAGREDTTTSGSSGSGRASGSALLNRNSNRQSATISSYEGASISLKSRVE